MIVSLSTLKVDGHLVGINLLFVPMSLVLSSIFHGEGKQTDWIFGPYPRLSFIKFPCIFAFFLQVISGIDYIEAALLLSDSLAFAAATLFYVLIQWRRLRSAS